MTDLRSVQLLEACDRGDESRMEQLGWRPVLDALRFWPKRLSGGTLAPYCSLLGDEDPDVVVAALRAMAASAYRPAPAEVYVHIHGAPQREPERPDAGVTRRADNSEAAFRAVLDEAVMGAEVCDCVPRSPQMDIDRHGVLWCSACGNLEPGQYDQALEWENPTKPEPPAPSTEDIKRWARDEQLLRLRQGKQPSPLLRKLMGGDDETMRKLAATFGLAFSLEVDGDRRP